MTAASKAQQTADAVTLNLSKNYNTKAQNDALYATQTSLKATSDSLSANITANAKTAQSAVDKATSLEANLNGFKTTVSQTYGHGSNLWVNPTFDADKPQIGSLVDDVTAPNGSKVNLLKRRDHFNPDTNFPVVPDHTYVITAICKQLIGDFPLHAGIWYTLQTSGLAYDSYANAESVLDLSDGWKSATWRVTCPDGKSRGCVYFQIDNWPVDVDSDSNQWYISNVTCVDVTGLQPAGDYATNSSLTQTANSIKAEVTEVSKTANGAMSKATTVEQTANGLSSKITEQGKTLNATVKTANEAKSTADGNKATISQVSTTAGNALTKASSVEQNLNGFKTTVSQTYTTNAATEELRKSSTQTFKLDGSNGTGSKWVKLGYMESKGDSSSVVIHVYSGSGYNSDPGQNAEFEIFIKDGYNEAQGAANAFGVSVQRIRNADNVKVKVMAFESTKCDVWAYLPWDWWSGSYTIQGNYNMWQDGPNTGGNHIQSDEPTNGTPQNHAYDSISTKSYVDQTAKSVALGVVQDYKGSDGSGLATKSDITVAKDSITTTVSKTYQTKADMKNYATQSQLTQTNDKVTIAFQNSQSVGGQNLLLKTSVPTVVTGSGAANQCVAFYNLAVGSLKNLPVGMYHMQFKIKSDTDGGTAIPQWNTEPWQIGDSMNIGTEEQTYSVDYYITDNNYPDAKQMSVRLDNAQGNVTIREMKLEPGNSMTPWTAAPEDTINDLTNTVQNQATDIANKVSNDDYTGYVNATNKNLSDIQDSQQHLSDSVNNEIKLRESYIQFGQDASNPYMDMGNSSSPNKMRLTNTKLSFTSNNIEVASVSNDKMRISNAEVLQSFRIGNFVWQPRSDGHMALKYSPEV